MKKGAFLEGLARFLVLTSICILCLASIVHADGYNEGDGGNGWGGNGGEIIGGDVDNGDDFPDGTSLDVIGDAAEQTKYETKLGQKLIMDLRLYCHHPNRLGFGDEAGGEGGGALGKFVKKNTFNKHAYAYAEDWDETEPLPPFVFQSRNPDYASLAAPLEGALDIHPSEGSYEWDLGFSDYPNIQLDTNPSPPFEKAKLHRFEGKKNEAYGAWKYNGCIPYFGIWHYFDYTNDEERRWFSYSGLTGLHRYPQVGDETGKVNIYSLEGFDILWDEDPEQCNAVQGDWLENEGPFTSANSFIESRCCGDDTSWIKNKAIYEDENVAPTEQVALVWDGSPNDDVIADKCLYATHDRPGTEDSIIPITLLDGGDAGSGTNYYTCGQTNFQSYDLTLNRDEEGVPAVRTTPNFFEGEYPNEVDLGKWSSASTENPVPMFCSYSFEEKIEKYQWKNVNEVGEEFVGAFGGPLVDMDGELDTGRAPESICEEFLGGIWTGNHCCGNKYAYPSNGYIDEYFSDPSPADQFPANHACIAAEAVQSGQQREIESTVTTNEDGDFVQNSFLSADGVVYGCNLETDDIPNEYFLPNGDVPSNGLPSEDKIQNADACAVVYSNLEFSGGGFAFVCDSIANTWLNTGDPIVQTERNADLSIENIHTSYSWDDPSQLSPACCFDNGCFDGEQGVCVPQHETKILNSGEANEEVYSCLAGSWGNPLDEDYDWFYNTNIEDESRTFCAEPFSCSCSTTSADDTYCGDDAVDDAIVRVDGCTMESNYFINDHYCEPGTVSGQWTSRTKLLAIQLMQMAGTNEYTLFCDDHANALNDQTMTDYLVADDINNLCVLRYNDGQEHVVLGTTFNGDSDEALTTELEEGLFGSGGFIQAVGADIDDTECLDALTIHGTIPADFQPCASASELWINAELGAAIYSAEGPLTLPTLNVAAGNDDLQDFYDEITTHLNDNIDAVEDEILEPEVFNNILEFNTVYLQETSATEYTFGVEEIRHVIRHVPGMDENRYFTAIVYAGTTLNCDLVEEAYILQSLNGAGAVYCGTDGSNSFIFERSSSGSIFWKDLGAKLRW